MKDRYYSFGSSFLPLLLVRVKKGQLFLPLTELQPLHPGHITYTGRTPFHIAKTQIYLIHWDWTFELFFHCSANDRDAAFQTGKMDGMITDYPSAMVLQTIHHADLGFILRMMAISALLSLKK